MIQGQAAAAADIVPLSHSVLCSHYTPPPATMLTTHNNHKVLLNELHCIRHQLIQPIETLLYQIN